MCFFTNTTNGTNPKVAKSDITCFKQLYVADIKAYDNAETFEEIDNVKFRSKVRGFVYRIGKHYKLKKSDLDTDDVGRFVNVAYHSYSNLEQMAWDMTSDYTQSLEVVVRCTIPKGSKYLKTDVDNEYVSNEIIINEVIWVAKELFDKNGFVFNDYDDDEVRKLLKKYPKNISKKAKFIKK